MVKGEAPIENLEQGDWTLYGYKMVHFRRFRKGMAEGCSIELFKVQDG